MVTKYRKCKICSGARNSKSGLKLPVSSRIAENLEKIPGIETALKAPIIDVEQAQVVEVMELVILALEKEVPTKCKDSLLVQTITGRFDCRSWSGQGLLKRSP